MPSRTPYNRRAAPPKSRFQRQAKRAAGSFEPESVVRTAERGEFLVREGRTAEAASLYRRMLRMPAAATLGPWLESALSALAAPAGDLPRPTGTMTES